MQEEKLCQHELASPLAKHTAVSNGFIDRDSDSFISDVTDEVWLPELRRRLSDGMLSEVFIPILEEFDEYERVHPTIKAKWSIAFYDEYDKYKNRDNWESIQKELHAVPTDPAVVAEFDLDGKDGMELYVMEQDLENDRIRTIEKLLVTFTQENLEFSCDPDKWKHVYYQSVINNPGEYVWDYVQDQCLCMNSIQDIVCHDYPIEKKFLENHSSEKRDVAALAEVLGNLRYWWT